MNRMNGVERFIVGASLWTMLGGAVFLSLTLIVIGGLGIGEAPAATPEKRAAMAGRVYAEDPGRYMEDFANITSPTLARKQAFHDVFLRIGQKEGGDSKRMREMYLDLLDENTTRTVNTMRLLDFATGAQFTRERVVKEAEAQQARNRERELD